jgi:2-polyprenyl-3-methyl-5-hydroxy-6-metoxy-1,4-benzoquinol methylase
MVESVGHDSFGVVPPDWYYKASKRNLAWMLPRAVKKVLEIGCAEGNFGAYLKKQYGAEVWGIELNPEIAEKAREKLDKVYAGDAALIIDGLEDGAFDCIIMLDVLEHIMNPTLLLKKVKKHLTSDGFLILCVPNVLYASNIYRLLLEKDWKYISHGILDITHLRFFTRKSLIRFLNESGYEIVEIHGIEPLKGWFLLPFYLIDLLSLGYYHEIKYSQFAAVIRPK